MGRIESVARRRRQWNGPFRPAETNGAATSVSAKKARLRAGREKWMSGRVVTTPVRVPSDLHHAELWQWR